MQSPLDNPIFELIGKTADEMKLKAWVVGGFVRDSILKHENKDIDIVVVGNGVDFAQAVAKNFNNDCTLSVFRNYSGFSKTWLKNQHIMMSFPIGAEIKLIGNDNISLNIAGTIQPTVVINNQAYMISTNMRNYAKAPSLYREFNVAGGAEAFLSIKRKSLRFNVGPQFRYQLISSYKKPYPISEHLTDYGLKVSIGR